MKTRKLKTPQEIRDEWLRKGMTQADWARQHGFAMASVSQVMIGKSAASRGVGHKIAVLLALKDGEIVEDNGHEHA